MEPNLSQPPTETTHWPAKPIFAWGTFGGPTARLYHRRCAIALAAVAVGTIGGALAHLHLIAALSPGVGFSYIAWEFRKYLATLDELARRIQLESIAWTYLSGLAVAMLLGGAGVIYGWRVNPLWFIVLEPVRGIWLYLVSRRYQ